MSTRDGAIAGGTHNSAQAGAEQDAHAGTVRKARNEAQLPRHVVDAIVAVLFFIFGMVVVVQSIGLGSGWTEIGPGAGYFPFWIGLAISLASLWILYLAIRARRRERRDEIARMQVGNWRLPTRVRSFTSMDALLRIWSLFWPLAVFVILIDLVGIYVAMLAFLIFFMRVRGHHSWTVTLVTAITTVVVAFLMFEIWFMVPLPKGIVEEALGLL